MYFLAIVSQQDHLRGMIEPSYILCKSGGDSPSRSPWRVYRANENFPGVSKVLVKWPSGSEEMIDFMSHYRTRDHMHQSGNYRHERTKKYYPKGALFWFECNEYGEAEGPAVFVKFVPDPDIVKTDNGKQRLDDALSHELSAADILCRDPWSVSLNQSGIKPKLVQSVRSARNKD